ncbi:hypothetical protein A33Q_4509 [Indibacter alkaliphilus LW1]|uniref:Uncharacterized protein n=1 Tax=Indibacter alkaliphilus (strain CCUG 57479 / KCTC 22604 / LW1) TaxID=1189612 RepID=S2DK96_INDAL|nr:hypothetical protein A33Q_4509 [Indibacter alkaliphilus LW1]
MALSLFNAKVSGKALTYVVDMKIADWQFVQKKINLTLARGIRPIVHYNHFKI